MRRINNIFIIIAIVAGISNISYSQDKLAQTGLNFLDVSSDARSSAMGGAVNSISGFSGALSHNPSSMADMKNLVNATFSINQWIADINYTSASLIISPNNGNFGVIGFSLQAVDYGDVEGTIVNPFDPEGYTDTGLLNPTAMALGIGYAKMLNEQFSVGAQIRYAYQILGETILPDGHITKKDENKVTALAYDFGTIYKTGIKSLAFGMSVRNFSPEVKYAQEGFELPLLFTIGVSANLFDFIDAGELEQSLLLSIDATHPRAHPEQIKVGAEYNFMKILSLRGGYVSGNSEDAFSFGLGVAYSGFEVDYAYTPFGIFNYVQRFTARISL